MSTTSITQTAPRFRKLRIAWSMWWTAVAVLLCLLCVRSYYYLNSFSFPITSERFIAVESVRGEVCSFTNYYVVGYYSPTYGRHYPWDFRNDQVAWYQHRAREADEFRGIFGAGLNWSPPLYAVAAPYWLCVLIAAGLAAAPWLHWRFSLRTLLIVTSLVAVILGAAMYWSPKPATSPHYDHVDLPVF